MESELLVALRLAKEWHCTPQAVLETPVDLVLAGMEYVSFQADYEETVGELNKPT